MATSQGSEILVLSPTPSHPHDFGNRKRIFQMCSGLKQRGARISFVHYPLESDWRDRCPAQALAQMREAWDDVHIVPPSVPVHAASKLQDHTIDEWWDPSVESFLRWYLQARNFDAMLVNYTYLSRALTLRRRGCLGILDTHDKFSGRRELLASIGIAPEFYHTTEAEERIGLQRADLVLALKDQEQSVFEGMTENRVLTLPFSEEARWIHPAPPDPEGYLRVGLLGARNNLNLFNMRRFLERAVAYAANHFAPVRFVLAGSMCTDLGPLFDNEHCVEIMGPVVDIADFYKSVDVVAVPMEVSSGQKIKIGEALAFGVPLISHAHAFEGYVPSHKLHQCSSFEQMAEACVGLAFDRDGLQTLAAGCRRSWLMQSKAADTAMDRVIESITAFRPRELFVVDATRLAQDGYLQAHLLSMGHLVSTFARVSFLLLGDFDERLTKFAIECRPWSQLLVTGIRDGVATAEGAQHCDGLNRQLRRERFARVWLYDSCELEELTRQELPVVAVRHLSRNPATGASPSTLINSDGLDFVLGSFAMDRDHRIFRISESFPSSVVDAMRARALFSTFSASGKRAIWIVASPPNEALARALTHMLLDLRERRPIVLIGGMAHDDRIDALAGVIRHGSATGFDISSARTKPECIIDLTCRDDPARLITCMFEGSQTPLWRPALTARSADNAGTCPLPTLIDGFLSLIRGNLPKASATAVTSRLDLSGLYNRLAIAYAHIR